MPQSRNLRRQRKDGSYYLVRKDGALEPCICGKLTYQAGVAKVSQGQARMVTDEYGNLIGFEVIHASRPIDAGSEFSSCVISRREMDLIAGQWMRGGASHTAGLTEKQRLERSRQVSPRTLKYLPEMDAVEQATVKLECFQPVTAAKRVHVVVPPPSKK